MTYADRIRRLADARGLPLPGPSDPEPLAALDYAEELALKQEALRSLWDQAGLPGRPDPIAPSPEPRGYRTTTKRRASFDRRGLRLVFPGSTAGDPVTPSVLDRPEHLAVYRALPPLLARASGRALAEALNWVVVRGRDRTMSLLLNVRVFDAAVVRGGKQIADALRDSDLGVASALLYLDPTASDYYLEARRPAGVLSEKRLFGPAWLEVRVEGLKLRFPPTAFSQVNEGLLPVMVAAVRELAGPIAGRDLVDLYCGYGLFSLTVGAGAAHVTGIDHDGPAIEAARGNAEHARGVRARFLSGRVTADFLASRVPPARRPEALILDPPRQGTEAQVVATLARRRPERVVHVCCGTDEIPREVASWASCGYQLQRARPLDMFAGTPNLETLLQLAPK